MEAVTWGTCTEEVIKGKFEVFPKVIVFQRNRFKTRDS